MLYKSNSLEFTPPSPDDSSRLSVGILNQNMYARLVAGCRRHGRRRRRAVVVQDPRDVQRQLRRGLVRGPRLHAPPDAARRDPSIWMPLSRSTERAPTVASAHAVSSSERGPINSSSYSFAVVTMSPPASGSSNCVRIRSNVGA